MLTRLLRHLHPFDGLDQDALTTAARYARTVGIAAGRRIGQSGDWLCYLLEGTVALEGGDRVRAGTARSSRPLLAPGVRPLAAITLEPCRILWIDVCRIAFLLETSLPPFYTPTWLDDGEDGDWQERFLRAGLAGSRPVLLARLFAAFDAVRFEASEILLREGDCGRDFYVVAEGRVELARRDGFSLVLTPGDAFGEEAIFGDGRRNASVCVPAGARLMRLREADFQGRLLPALIRAPEEGALRIECVRVDLDRALFRRTEARAWTRQQLGTAAGQSIEIVGGTAAERLKWAFFAARAGARVLLGER
jgi:hypothetical protein